MFVFDDFYWLVSFVVCESVVWFVFGEVGLGDDVVVEVEVGVVGL